MISLKISGQFFDRQKVIRAMDSATRKALSQAGAFIRQAARTSMRYRKAASPPGQPPSAHKPNAYLRELLFFSYDPAKRSVVIGPEKHGLGTVPRLLEEGGSVTVRGRRGERQRVTIAARPYMAPALARELPQLPRRWKGSVRS